MLFVLSSFAHARSVQDLRQALEGKVELLEYFDTRVFSRAAMIVKSHREGAAFNTTNPSESLHNLLKHIVMNSVVSRRLDTLVAKLVEMLAEDVVVIEANKASREVFAPPAAVLQRFAKDHCKRDGELVQFADSDITVQLRLRHCSVHGNLPYYQPCEHVHVALHYFASGHINVLGASSATADSLQTVVQSLTAGPSDDGGVGSSTAARSSELDASGPVSSQPTLRELGELLELKSFAHRLNAIAHSRNFTVAGALLPQLRKLLPLVLSAEAAQRVMRVQVRRMTHAERRRRRALRAAAIPPTMGVVSQKGQKRKIRAKWRPREQPRAKRLETATVPVLKRKPVGVPPPASPVRSSGEPSRTPASTRVSFQRRAVTSLLPNVAKLQGRYAFISFLSPSFAAFCVVFFLTVPYSTQKCI